jgi:hypothetical protein
MGNVNHSVRKDSGKGGGGNKAALIVTIVIIIAVVAVLAGVVGFLLTHRKTEEIAEETERRNVVVTQDNVDEIVAEMSEAELIEPGYFETSMTNDWHFSSGNDVSKDAYVANVVSNTNDIYFDVVLAEDESQVIYKSPVIPIGASLDNIALDTPLDPGTHNCVVIYHLIDEDQNTISTLRIAIKVTIDN